MSGLERILYVEDDMDIQTIAVMALEKISGYTVLACSSGRDAVEKAAEFTPDLLLLDVMMPEMDGPETLAALRTQKGLEQTPVIFMTAKVMESEIAHYKTLGAIGVIPKPFDPMSLGENVKSIWDESNE